MSDTLLILHVKGTQQETTTLPKDVVRAAISQGQITHSQLIWSTSDNAWKQVRELPPLLPSQNLAPPPERVPTGHLPKIAAVPKAQTGLVPRVVGKATGGLPVAKVASGTPKVQTGGGQPKVKVAGATPAVRVAQASPVRSAGHHVVKEEHESHPLKWVCIVLGVVILAALGVNYLLVDRPLTSGLAQTSYASVPVYAHLGAFMQPNVMVIHIPASTSVTKDNLIDFLIAVAKSTPQSPFASKPFDRVAITSEWTGRYSFSGYAWREFGDMGKDDVAQQKEFLLDQVTDAGGEPLMQGTATLNDDALQAKRNEVWDTFAAQFTNH